MKYILAPSILAADFSRLRDELKTCEEAGATYIHIDVMDGNFVPNISFGAPLIKSLRKCSKAIFDVHLMIDEPIRYITDFKDAGADIITFHYEAAKHVDRTIFEIHESGIKAGVALNPSTPVIVLKDILSSLDSVLLMGVNPGFGGQKYIPYVTGKIKELKSMVCTLGMDLDIEVDGGVTFSNIKSIQEAGVNIFVSGSRVFNGDISENIRKFLKILG